MHFLLTVFYFPQLELCGGQGDSITLERCVNLTDWGLHWLAKILSKRYHVQKVIYTNVRNVNSAKYLKYVTK